ncbi:hypothetical protein F5984_10285 [Rudanella paleaurantiibacter]|uniref:Aromatic hydrocarbon degradation protein n=1 Tax=Rudanella paleaurantiibacter TaxID=2614655 RepID=A0A7J5U2I1_9BACT|nr:hypothetical protein [Rudanella paleaurantiibacter]KAB7731184.1 hypothetical protein F5984_10285 [Rudanella paleaurantiibacter]
MTTRLLIFGGLLFGTGAAFGQTGSIYADAAFQYNEIQQSGTARFRGIGGNHTALGGDASTLFGNPAGLGFYNRSELSFSPTFLNNSSQTTYLGSTTTDSRGRVAVGQLGLILAGGDNGNSNRRWRRTTFGVGYHQNINFNNGFTFEGLNRRSSLVDNLLDDANRIPGLTGGQLNNGYDPNIRQADDLLAAAYQLYLVNGTPDAQGNNTRAPFFSYDLLNPRSQQNTFESSGSQSQWTVAYAGNLDDKLYLGINVGLSRLRYNSDNVLTEVIQGGNSFGDIGQRDRLTVSGNGINATLGAIYKLTPSVQIGATVASPNFMRVTETFTQNLRVNPVDPNLADLIVGELNATDVDVAPNDFDYSITGPLRASGGATVFLGGGKIGFLTASAEYVGYAGMRANTSGGNASDNSAFRNNVRNSVQQSYQNVVNVRAGAEFRAGMFRIRGGAAYLPDADISRRDNIDRTRLLISGGLGYRNDRFFADVSGTFNTTEAAFTPYTRPNPADYGSALINNKLSTVTLSLGTFF